MAMASLDDVKTYLGIVSPTAAVTALLTLCHERSEELIKDFVGYRVGPYATVADVPSYTEYLPSQVPARQGSSDGLSEWDAELVTTQDLSRLYLRELPVREITSIHVNSTAYGVDANWSSVDAIVEGTDCFLDRRGTGFSTSGILYNWSNWPSAPRSVKVVYKAGYLSSEIGATNFPKASIVATAAAWRQALAMQGTVIGQGFGPITREQVGTWQGYYDVPTVREVAGLINDLPKEVKRLLQKLRSYFV